MTSGSTREFLALCAIVQHFGRPGTPTDQAWIESLFGHLKVEHPHLLAIDDAEVLRVELDVRQRHYNTVRLHAGIGYVTPDDEHEGRGKAIRKAAKPGLSRPGCDDLRGTATTATMSPTTDPTMEANQTPNCEVESDTRQTCTAAASRVSVLEAREGQDKRDRATLYGALGPHSTLGVPLPASLAYVLVRAAAGLLTNSDDVYFGVSLATSAAVALVIAFAPLVDLAVAIILFEGGLDLVLSELEGHSRRVVRRLLYLGIQSGTSMSSGTSSRA